MTIGLKPSMTTTQKENEEFAQWVQDWIAVIQQNRDPVEGKLSEKKDRAHKQEYSEGANLPDPKPRAKSGRCAA